MPSRSYCDSNRTEPGTFYFVSTEKVDLFIEIKSLHGQMLDYTRGLLTKHIVKVKARLKPAACHIEGVRATHSSSSKPKLALRHLQWESILYLKKGTADNNP
jgi:hypothetical protein